MLKFLWVKPLGADLCPGAHLKEESFPHLSGTIVFDSLLDGLEGMPGIKPMG